MIIDFPVLCGTMANTEVELKFYKSKRGFPKVAHDGFSYCLESESGDSKYWKCDQRPCKGRAITCDNRLVSTRPHNIHESDPITESKIGVSAIRASAGESYEKTSQIIHRHVASVSSAARAEMPTTKTLKRMVQRKRVEALPRLPSCSRDFIIEGEWSETTDGEDWAVGSVP